jgi:hypothetical protein
MRQRVWAGDVEQAPCLARDQRRPSLDALAHCWAQNTELSPFSRVPVLLSVRARDVDSAVKVLMKLRILIARPYL